MAEAQRQHVGLGTREEGSRWFHKVIHFILAEDDRVPIVLGAFSGCCRMVSIHYFKKTC